VLRPAIVNELDATLLHQRVKRSLLLRRSAVLPPPLQEVHLIPHEAPPLLRVVAQIANHTVQNAADIDTRQVLRSLQPPDVGVRVWQEIQLDGRVARTVPVGSSCGSGSCASWRHGCCDNGREERCNSWRHCGGGVYGRRMEHKARS
jgi:hypothetical protein